MSRNQNSHFSMIPRANVKRSRFDISNNVKTTFNAGKLIPVEWWEVLPGDTFSVDASILTRMQTLITPLMDDMYLDVYFFYVPNRLLWNNWQAFCGENNEPWFDEEAVYEVPQHAFNMSEAFEDESNADLSVQKGTVADYLGLPFPIPDQEGDNMVRVSALPFRAYVRIWNEWFRNENVQGMAAFNNYDTGTTQNSSGDALYGGELLPVNKYRDYFTSVLPGPQKHESVTIGVGDLAPVFTGATANSYDTLKHGDTYAHSLAFLPTNESNSFDASSQYNILGINTETTSNKTLYAAAHKQTSAASNYYVMPSNLYADISAATGISINELRLAFATQRYYETIARSGSRYIELLDGVFGVQAPDQRLQRSEYLGGQRVHININSVIQQSETGTTPLGNLGAYSLTTDTQNCFTKSFVEHGILMCMAAVRYDHSYQDGIGREWMKEDFFDFYNPLLANIGEQPVWNAEIYAQGTNADKEVFGYQEAWASYRYKNNRVSGEFRSRYAQTLDFWHLADEYDSQPYLSEEWIQEDGNTVDRALAVSARVSDQFMLDAWFSVKATRPMPLYSIPGLDIL